MAKSKDKVFSLSTLIGLTATVVATILMVFSCLIVISVPCISNFYNEMPVYPGAELTEQKSSPLNWIGAGELELTYRSPDESDTVEAWYRNTMIEAQRAASRAQVAGEPIPVTWNHFYRISTASEGTDITLEADCLN